MSPLLKTLCCLLGLAAAGAPLVWLTAPQPETAAQQALPQTAESEPMLITLRCSGTPQELSIRHEGRCLCHVLLRNGVLTGAGEHEVHTDAAAGAVQARLPLPRPQPGATLELELQAHRPQNTPGAQAATIELTPDKLPTRSDTRWAPPGSCELHDIFTFTW